MQENIFRESHAFHQVEQANQQPYENEELLQNLPHDGTTADAVSDLVQSLTVFEVSVAALQERQSLSGVPGNIPMSHCVEAFRLE